MGCNGKDFIMQCEAPERPAVSCSDWLDGGGDVRVRMELKDSGREMGFRRIENNESQSGEKRDFKMNAALTGLQ